MSKPNYGKINLYCTIYTDDNLSYCDCAFHEGERKDTCRYLVNDNWCFSMKAIQNALDEIVASWSREDEE
jgi:hypothetical protein